MVMYYLPAPKNGMKLRKIGNRETTGPLLTVLRRPTITGG
jgi:hypothetical protein